MKKIEINGTVLYYLVYVGVLDFNTADETRFYTSTKLKPSWSFLWFKSKKIVEVPDNYIFSINYDVTNCFHTKEWIKYFIERELNKYLRLKERCAEIARGEII